jgi:hypothetical protein
VSLTLCEEGGVGVVGDWWDSETKEGERRQTEL